MEGPVTIKITPGTILATFGIGLLVWLLFYLQDIVLIVLTAIVLASSIEPAVAWFMHHRLPRVIGVLLVYLIVFGVFFGAAYAFFPPLLDETTALFSSFPEYLGSFQVEGTLSNVLIETTQEAVQSSPSVTDSLFQLKDIFTATGEGAFRAVSSIFGGVISFVLIIVLSFYFAVNETGIDDFLRIVTPVKYQEYALSLWRRSHTKIGLWMQGQLLLSLLMGVLVYLWLTILGVPYALVIALFAAVAELVPVFGSIVAGVVAAAVGFSVGGVTTGLLVAGGFIIFNQLQSHLIYPLVVKKIVGVAPLMVILALVVGAQLAGFLGILLSVPIAAALQEFVSDIQKRKQNESAQA